ncbi:SDR family oxidoreductase [Mesorhizobium sp. M0814]|uniref:SDR family oxidoreductase n=1 Tax=Mesorhizobium sp. M0814 TaxID=2957004 RepID=UPI003338822C
MISTNLERRKALVLGGGKGLGFGVAEALAAKGAEIILVGRGKETLDAARRAIESAGPVCSTFSADLSDNDSVSRLIRAIEDEHQRIDIVLLNGGGPPPFAASVFDASVWEKQFTSMVLSQMRIAVSSTSVREPIPGLTASNALRASLAGWAKTLAGEVAADGVTVNLLLPGRFATDRTKQFDAMDAADRGVDAAVIAAESEAEIPAKRYGTPAEFGAVAAFLASDDATYITGVALPVDGGLSRAML